MLPDAEGSQAAGGRDHRPAQKRTQRIVEQSKHEAQAEVGVSCTARPRSIRSSTDAREQAWRRWSTSPLPVPARS